jgi:hypothetical protein
MVREVILFDMLSSWSGLKTIRPYANPALVDTAFVN